MTYLVIEDFKGGLDQRRMELTSPSGSLQTLKNAHITRGGEIEKGKAFVADKTLPSGTFGLGSIGGGLFVFGSGADPGVPSGVTYVRLDNPDSSEMVSVDDVDIFSGKLYVVATYDDGTQHHFYNGTIIDDWYEGLVRSSMTDLNTFANTISTVINAEDTDVTSGVAGLVITITADLDNTPFTDIGTAVNGGSVDDQTISVATTQAATASLPQIDTVTLGGTFDPGDTFTVTINDNQYGASRVTGRTIADVRTHKDKIYAASLTDLLFSGVAEPTKWKSQATGSGIIDMSSQAASSDENLTALGIYQNLLAVFTRRTTQIWAMDPDPAANVQLQVLDNVGTRSPGTVISFGDLDVFFLGDSGYRSLRGRDSSNQAGVSDIGTPIDTLVVSTMAGLTDTQIENATGVIEPKDGRYISSLGDKMFVFSFFESSKVSSWSTYERALTVSNWATIGNRIYARAGDTIYLVGGTNDTTYDNPGVEVEFPYLDGNKMATWKRWKGLDVALEGEWTIEINTDPGQPDTWETVAMVDQSTYTKLSLGIQTRSPLIKLRFTNADSNYARIGNVAMHFVPTRDD